MADVKISQVTACFSVMFPSAKSFSPSRVLGIGRVIPHASCQVHGRMSVCVFLYLFFMLLCSQPNGLRYLRWGGDGEAVQPEK